MSRYQIVGFPATVYREGDIPLVDGAPPVVTPEPTAPTRPGPPWWAVGWYIVHLGIIGAVWYTLCVDAEGYCTNPFQPLAALPAALALWGITLTVRRVARRRTR